MRRRHGGAGAALLGLWLVLQALPAAADPCEGLEERLEVGPLQAALREGELGLARSACPRNGLGLTGEGWLVAAPDDFYGQLRGALRLSGSYTLNADMELFGSLEVLRYQQVISSLSAEEFGAGHLSLGATRRVQVRERRVLALTGRLVVPTLPGVYRNVWPVGVDASLVFEQVSSERLRLHGQVGLVGSVAFSPVDSQPRLGLALTLGGSWRLLEWVAVVAEVHVVAGYSTPFDTLAPGLGLRFGGGHLRVSLEGFVPVRLAGRREPITAALQLAWSP